MTVPPEIVDAIIDYLHDDKATLLACSLCKDLLESSRYHLFSELLIQPRTGDLFPLLDLLSAPSGGIAPFVRRLVFDNIASQIFHYGVPDVARAIRNMPRLVWQLPLVDSLRFSNIDFEHLPQEISAQLFFHFRNFGDLELQSLHFFRFSEFVDLVCAFPTLKRLSVKWVNWTINARTVQTLARASPWIGWHIFEVAGRSLAEWLSAHDPPATVHSFYYDAKCPNEKRSIRSLLRQTGPSLKHLQIFFPIYSEPDIVSDTLDNFIDLSGCKNLLSLHCKQILLLPGDAVTLMIRPWIARILSQIPSDQMQDLLLEFILPASQDGHGLEELDWDGVAMALSQPQFRKLARITIVMKSSVPFDSMEAVRLIRDDKLSIFKAILRMHFPDGGTGC